MTNTTTAGVPPLTETSLVTLQHIERILSPHAPPAAVHDVSSLSDEKQRLRLAADAGRHSLIVDVRNAIRTLEQRR